MDDLEANNDKLEEPTEVFEEISLFEGGTIVPNKEQ